MEIIGFPDYLIYPDGRVYSKKGKGRFLKPRPNGVGYDRVQLRIRGEKPIDKYIHRLVAQHYIPNPENKKEVDHINYIRNDNRVENLQWVTSTENNEFQPIRKDNTSGHKNIRFDEKNNRWGFMKQRKNQFKIQEYFKTKTDCLCYKYIIMLKIKAKLI
jgi:hypothetical protein